MSPSRSASSRRHRGLGVGQVDPRQRDPLPRGRQPPAPGAAASRRPRRESTASSRSTRSSTSTSRRSGARRARTPPPTPALFDHIRELFADTRESRARGYKPGRFSFNVKGGRCEVCKGDGQIKIEMHFLPDVYVPCEQCHGRRYNRETLEVRFKGKSIADVLEMPVAEAVEFFAQIPKIHRRLQTLHDVGLDYIRLGQPATPALRRRGAAGEARHRALQGGDRADAVHPRRADHRPPLRRRRAPARGPRPARRPGQHGARDRAQPRRDQDRRLDHRPRPRGRRGRGRARSRPGPRSRSPARRPPTPASSCENSSKPRSRRRSRAAPASASRSPPRQISLSRAGHQPPDGPCIAREDWATGASSLANGRPWRRGYPF